MSTVLTADQDELLGELIDLTQQSPMPAIDAGPQWADWRTLGSATILPVMETIAARLNTTGNVIDLRHGDCFYEMAVTPNVGHWNRFVMTFRYLPLHDQIIVNSSTPLCEHRVLIPRKTTTTEISELLFDFLSRAFRLNKWNEV